MDKHILQVILETFDDSEVRSYSGRGMMGKECLAVTTPYSQGCMMAHIIRCLANETDHHCFEQVAEALRRTQSDRMGHDSIYYFPTVAFFKGDEGEGDNEEDEG